MIYWLFTDGRELLSSLLIPLSCLTLLMPLIVSAVFGAGIQRSSDIQSISGWKRGLKLFTHGIVLLGITTIYLSLASNFAIETVRGRQSTNAFIRTLTGGPDNIDHMRLFGFGVMLVFVWVVISIGLHSGLKNGGWLRERVDRLRTPQVRRGALGSSHFCSQREYKRFRREDPEGLTLLGAFWGESKRRLDLGTGRFCLGGEDIARGILTLGGPGSGKTQGIILPAIADRMLAGHSLVVADPQGEITGHILKYAAVTRHLVVVHDPTSTVGPRYNLAQGIDNVSDARAIADVLVDWEPLPAIVDPEQAMAEDAPQLFETLPNNIAYSRQRQANSVEDAFAGAFRIVKQRLISQRLAGIPLETRAVVAAPDATTDGVTVWTSTQTPHLVRDALAGVLDLPTNQVRVVAPEVGGGFGVKIGIYPEEALLAVLARMHNLPLR